MRQSISSFVTALLLGAALSTPTAYAWVLHERDTPIIVTEYEPDVVAVGFATLDGPTEPVAGSCDNESVEVLVSGAYYHAGSDTYRRNIAVSLNPPSAAASASCQLMDGTTVIRGIFIEFTGAGVQYPHIEIEFTSAG